MPDFDGYGVIAEKCGRTRLALARGLHLAFEFFRIVLGRAKD
ncbi:hypothetical protein [Aminobacter sp. HY435]|nr:hypothetical protein [Aminobacter sp. HY435]